MSLDDLHKEVKYRTSRSSGAGGQNVNKVSTKVELLFDVVHSKLLTERKKFIILAKLKNRISQDGILALQCDETRSQLKNKQIVYQRFIELLTVALTPVKKRKPSKPKKSAIQKRLTAKKKLSQKKDSRKFNPDND